MCESFARVDLKVGRDGHADDQRQLAEALLARAMSLCLVATRAHDGDPAVVEAQREREPHRGEDEPKGEARANLHTQGKILTRCTCGAVSRYRALSGLRWQGVRH